MDVLSASQRQKNMQHIRAVDTKAEVLLRKTLWNKGLRYRTNYAALRGRPDIALTKYKIAIFVDGDFWHARGHEAAPGEQVASHAGGCRLAGAAVLGKRHKKGCRRSCQ